MDRALIGISASPGIVIGRVHILRWEVPEVPTRIIHDDAIPEEMARLHAAFARAKDRLEVLRERTSKHAGPEEAEIFGVQIAILEDPDLLPKVESFVRQNLSAEKAFDLVLLEERQRFEHSPLPMIRERVGDLTDVHIRVLSVLMGLPDHDPVELPKGANVVLVTHDLTPSLTVQLDREAISGIATDAGTRTSHVAILTRSLGLPAVVGLRNATARLRGDELVVLDGSSGLLIVNPSPAEIDTYRTRQTREEADEAELKLLTDSEPITTDGVRITLRANVDIPEEANLAAHSGAEGVGLMRTEFLLVGRATMPDEEEQYREYRRVIEAFGGRPVVIRTFDIGGDKLPVGGFPHEPNPFLGWRAIRMCLDEPVIFRTQLRALMRAGMHGDLRIMLPLVVTVDEVRGARKLMEEASAELTARDVAHRTDLPLGIMVETPAAVVAADTLAREVAFFSIGTNDLVQYTLAVDRGNANLANRFTPLHPAVLRLVRQTVQVAEAFGLEVAVCGEMASQPIMVFALIGLGLRQLSVNPRAVPLVKKIVRGISLGIAEEAAEAAMRAQNAESAQRELRFRLVAAFGNAPFLRDGLLGIGSPDIVP